MSTLSEMLSRIPYRHHDHVSAGHPGQKRTLQALSRIYYWPGMPSYINAYLESRVQCRGSKTLTQKTAGLPQPLIVPTRRWSHLSLDFVTDLTPTPESHDAVLVSHGLPRQNGAFHSQRQAP